MSLKDINHRRALSTFHRMVFNIQNFIKSVWLDRITAFCQSLDVRGRYAKIDDLTNLSIAASRTQRGFVAYESIIPIKEYRRIEDGPQTGKSLLRDCMLNP